MSNTFLPLKHDPLTLSRETGASPLHVCRKFFTSWCLQMTPPKLGLMNPFISTSTDIFSFSQIYTFYTFTTLTENKCASLNCQCENCAKTSAMKMLTELLQLHVGLHFSQKQRTHQLQSLVWVCILNVSYK